MTTNRVSPFSTALALAALAALTGCSGDQSGRGPADEAPAAAAGQSAPAATTPAAEPGAAPAAPAGPDGRAVFTRTCATCHQQHGRGMPGTFPPLEHSPYVNGDKGRLIRMVLHGLSGPLVVEGQRYNNVMPPWKSLSDAEMAAVLSYVRSNFGNRGDAVSPAEVARERAATASRTTMWTAAEIGPP